MASFKFHVSPEYERKLNEASQLFDHVAKPMLDAGAKVLMRVMKSTKFGKYMRYRRPRKNKHGWFAQIQFKGNVRSGTSAAVAATVYEYGRGGKNPQPARPEIRQAVQNAEQEVVDAMYTALDEYLDNL